MIQRAGAASFPLPNEWRDLSMYSYSSPDHFSKITLLFDSEIDEPTAEAVIDDRIDTMRDVLPGFRVEQNPSPIEIAGREGKVITFDFEDAGEVVRSRLVVVMLTPRQAIVITAQAPLDKWTELESAWKPFVADFSLTRDNPSSLAGGQI